MTTSLSIQIKRLPHAQDMDLPSYATQQSAGMDLCAAIESDIVLQPGERKLVPAGIAIALPQGFEAQVRPRSGLALKNGITVLNATGTIDADYRGEVGVVLVNTGTEVFTISRGMRIAQMIVAAVLSAVWEEVDVLGETQRGEGGFGSTGLKRVG